MSMIKTNDETAKVIEQVLVMGDLARLTPEQRNVYYKSVCESVGLNPLTRPFEYITLNGKLTLYARKDCTDQLRKLHGVSIRIADMSVNPRRSSRRGSASGRATWHPARKRGTLRKMPEGDSVFDRGRSFDAGRASGGSRRDCTRLCVDGARCECV